MQTLKKTVAAPRGASKAKTTTKAGKPRHEAHSTNTSATIDRRMELLGQSLMDEAPHTARDVLGSVRALSMMLNLLDNQLPFKHPVNARLNRMVSLAEQLEAEAETMCRAMKRRTA